MCRSKTYALCRSWGSLHYLCLRQLSRFRSLTPPRRFKFSDLTLTPDIRPRSAPSAVTVEAQPLQLPTQQRRQVIAESTPESAVPIPIELSSTPIEVSSSPSESPPGVRIESKSVWAPLVAGILPELSVESSPTPAGNTEFSTRENANENLANLR